MANVDAFPFAKKIKLNTENKELSIFEANAKYSGFVGESNNRLLTEILVSSINYFMLHYSQ